MSARTAPPFLADHVGSLLRTKPLKEARAQRERGEIDAATLKAVEDREIEKIIKRRIHEATKFVALDQLCLSPQCGFASTEEGNILAEDEQWAKLKMIVDLAEEVWGK